MKSLLIIFLMISSTSAFAAEDNTICTWAKATRHNTDNFRTDSKRTFTFPLGENVVRRVHQQEIIIHSVRAGANRGVVSIESATISGAIDVELNGGENSSASNLTGTTRNNLNCKPI
jgi:hypothetical protein